jgi:nucleotide-binding universal stress UspA family protein
MTVRDILLQANTHPEPTPDWAIERVAGLAARLGAKISLGICQVHIPEVSSWLANTMLKVDSMIAAENSKSAANGKALAVTFASAVPAEQRGDLFVIECPGMVTHWQLAVRARAHDLTIVPVYAHSEATSVAEGLVFESGRPVLLLPRPVESDLKLDRIAVAWDGSNVAARALADAMPLLRQAKSVAIVQITDEKDLSKATPLADVVRNLALHGIEAQAVEVALDERDAAAALQSWCLRDGRELLVMGAFGHSRAREFVLGGVTRSILHEPKLPILIAH